MRTVQFQIPPGGAEIVLTMLFVEVRGSTAIAETMPAVEFGRLMNHFYKVVMHMLVRAGAFIDQLVGDEVAAATVVHVQTLT